MSKEELERASAQEHASSVPPRPASSEPPRPLPSTPPSTDEIDTDWGAEATPAPPLALKAAEPSTPPQRISVAPPAPQPISVAPPAPEAATPPRAVPPQAAPVVRKMRSQTLMGIAPVIRAPASASAPPPPEPAPSATPPVEDPPPAGMQAAPAPSVHPRPLRSQTLIGLPAAKPAVRESVPPPEATAGASSTPLVRSSVPPPPPTRSSKPPPLASPLPPARSTAPLTGPGITSPVKVSALHVVEPSPPQDSGFGRWLALLGIGVVVVSVVGYRVLRTPAVSSAPMLPSASPTLPDDPSALVPTPSADAPPAASASAGTAPTAAAEPSAPVAPAPSSAAPANTASSAAPSGSVPALGKQTVLLTSIPPKARFFHFGKQVGVSPFSLELEPGEKHAYEVGLPGYTTRKVVVDGSKPEVTVGLTRETH